MSGFGSKDVALLLYLCERDSVKPRSCRPPDAASKSPVSAVHAAKGRVTTQEHVMVRAGRRRVRLRVPQADVWKGFAISADLRVRSSVNTHRTQEHRVKRSTRTHPSSGLISTRLVPRMTAKPSERVLGGTAGRPVSGSAIGANEPQEGKFLCPFPGLLTSEELTVQSLLDIVHHQVEKLIVSLQGARDYDW